MRPPDEMRLPGAEHLGAWERLTLWVSLNRPFVWLVGLTAGLILFLAWLPAYVRLFFWHGLQAQPVLASMTLGFSLAGALAAVVGRPADRRLGFPAL